MKITFLGTAGGRILIMTQIRASGGWILEMDGERIHVDPGPGALVRATQYGVDLRRLTGLVISHAHPDHYCLNGDSLIQLHNGEIKEIREIDTNPIISYDFKTLKQISTPYLLKTHKKTPKILFEIKTITKNIITTRDHRFFVLNGSHIQERKASELKKNDRIAVIRKLDLECKRQALHAVVFKKRYVKRIKLPEYADPKFCQIIGYFLGDGSNRGGRGIFVYDKDIGLLKYYKNFVSDVFGIDGKIFKMTNQNSYYLSLYSAQLVSFLNELGILKHSLKREIPSLVCKSPNEEIAGFIRGFFDAEGNVGHHSVRFVTGSKKIARVLQFLLLRFGIVSQIQEYKFKPKRKKCVVYHVVITNPPSLTHFITRIGSSCSAKRKKLNGLLNAIGNAPEVVDLIPLQEVLKNLKILLRAYPHDFREFYGYANMEYSRYYLGKHIPSRTNLSKMLKALRKRFNEIKDMNIDESSPKEIRNMLRYSQREIAKKLGVNQSCISLYEKRVTNSYKIKKCLRLLRKNVLAKSSRYLQSLEKILDSYILWDKVKEVKRVKSTENFVYDLTVPLYKNYVADGVIVHNCDAEIIVESMTDGTRKRRGVVAGNESAMKGGDDYRQAISPFHLKLLERHEVMKPGDKTKMGRVEITAIPAKHSEDKALGFVFRGSETLGYTGDGEYFDGQEKYFEGCDYLVLNVLRPRGTNWPKHMNTEQAAGLVAKVRPKLAILQHFGMLMVRAGEENEARWIEEQTGVKTIAAKDGMTIDLDSGRIERAGKAAKASGPGLEKWTR